jgi:hypothetical protein
VKEGVEMSLLSAPSARLYGLPAQDEITSCERCRHPAGAHHDATMLGPEMVGTGLPVQRLPRV